MGKVFYPILFLFRSDGSFWKVRGRPAPGDIANPEIDRLQGAYETACGRGVYSTPSWPKAESYAVPFVCDGYKVVAHVVLLIRVPGSLEDVGVTYQVGDVGKKKSFWQHDLLGNEIKLGHNWPIISSAAHHSGVAGHRQITAEDVRSKGLFRCLRDVGVSFDYPELRDLAERKCLPVDPELNKRLNRHAMQTSAEQGNRGEPRWTCMDCTGLECMSSSCSIVGFWVGYDKYRGRKNSNITMSRKGQAEHNVDWSRLPPMCRPNVSQSATTTDVRVRWSEASSGE